MAWFGSNLASLKSQITSFTKEVLIEGSQDIQDPNEELKVANLIVKESEVICNTLKLENDRLKEELNECIEKSEVSEYQTKKITSQYRALLEAKEDEIRNLKTEFTLPISGRIINCVEADDHETSPSISDEGGWSDWGRSASKTNYNPPKNILNSELEGKNCGVDVLKELPNDTLQNKIDHLSEKLYNAVKSEGLHISEIQTLKLQIEENDKRLTELSSENESYKILLEEKNRDIMGFLRGSSREHEHTDLQIMESGLLSYKDKCQKLTDELILIKLELVSKKARFKTSASQTANDTEPEIVEDNLMTEEKREMCLLLEEREELMQEHYLIKNKLLEAENEISLLEEENNELRDRLEDATMYPHPSVKEDEFSTVKLDKEIQADELQTNHEEIFKLSQENDVYKFKIKNLETLNKENGPLIYKLNSLEDERKKLLHEIEELKNKKNDEMNESQEVINSLLKHREESEAELKLHMEEIIGYAAKIAEKDNDYKLLLRSNETLKTEMNQLKNTHTLQLHQKEEEIEKSFKDKFRLENECLSMKTLFDAQKADLLVEVECLKNQLKSKDEISRNETEIASEIQRIGDDYMSQYNLVQNEYQSNTELSNVNMCYADAVGERNDSFLQIQSLKSELDTKNTTIAQYEKSAEKFNTEMDFLNKSYHELQNENEKCEGIIRILDAEKLGLENEISDLNSKLSFKKDILHSSMQTEIEDGELQLNLIKEQHNVKFKKEIQRLKLHLMEMEETCAAEAVVAENREVELRQKMSGLEDMSQLLQTQLNENNLNYDSQISGLNQILTQTTTQRDNYLLQLHTIQDEICALKAKNTNLQSALERVQKEKDDALSFELNATTNRLKDKEIIISDLKATLDDNELEVKKLQALSKSYTYLNQKLDERDKALNDINKSIMEKDKSIDILKNRMSYLEKKQGTAVEREVIKNLFLSYLNAPTERQRIEIGFLLGKMLEFNSVEIEKLGNEIEHYRGAKSWNLSNLWRPSGNNTNSNLDDKGLGELFIQFLEKESTPKILPKFNLTTSPIDQSNLQINTENGEITTEHYDLVGKRD
ncbi:unnamed protein product [Gordionus sp. m RMFG-2023]|uniref:thyroid receptor-interacting protein 11-like n=1 Tax=Gordionus sp. m RMFG-2023 TaxID=3053472 RepID=UPI0030DF19D4